MRQAIRGSARVNRMPAYCSTRGYNAVAPAIARLRKKLRILAGPAGQRLIKTEIGRGYVLTAEAVPAWPAAFPARSA